ncbi:MAG: M23 family metallopeptidase [Leucobacter sp.]|nr:M23 family metallopeptidase [Leucobacter sp.]
MRLIPRTPALFVVCTVVAGAGFGGTGPGGAGLWQPPLGHPLRIAAAYSLPNGPYRAGHRGIDLPTGPHEAVVAPTTGVVSFVGEVVDRPVISIRVDDRTVLSLEPVSSALREGEAVVPGQAIGVVETGGHCASTCLHLGLRVDGDYANPLRFLRPRPVLLPW